MTRSPEGATEKSSYLPWALSPAIAGSGFICELIPGLTPGATLCRHLRWLVEQLLRHHDRLLGPLCDTTYSLRPRIILPQLGQQSVHIRFRNRNQHPTRRLRIVYQAAHFLAYTLVDFNNLADILTNGFVGARDHAGGR